MTVLDCTAEYGSPHRVSDDLCRFVLPTQLVIADTCFNNTDCTGAMVSYCYYYYYIASREPDNVRSTNSDTLVERRTYEYMTVVLT
jgi:hypothetical protein